MLYLYLFVSVCALALLRSQHTPYVGKHRATVPAPTQEGSVEVAHALPHEPIFALVYGELAALADSAPTYAETYAAKIRTRVRKALMYRLSEFLRVNVPGADDDTFDRAMRSTIVVTEDDGVFVGAWDNLEDAATAIAGLDAEAREEILLVMDIVLPRNEAELEAHKRRTRAYLDALDAELWADVIARENTRVIEPVISSTERMRSLREQRTAAGLTTRGTRPRPACGAPTKAGTPCKRKANEGHTRCDWHFAVVSA